VQETISASSLTCKWVGEREKIVHSLRCSQGKKGLYIYMDGGEMKDFHALLAAAKMSWMGWSEIKGGDK
jgi:hypothetical protein